MVFKLTKVAMGFALAATVAVASPAIAETTIWSNSDGGLIRASDAATGNLLESFQVPNPGARGQQGTGIDVIGSNIYYSDASSGNVYLTNTSGSKCDGVAF
jgi:outer membrane protein assembly factor BamB